MQKFIVTGGVPLRGEVRIAGAKNAVLKMMAAAALTDDTSVLRNVPRISDVQILRGVMTDIGFSVKPLDGSGLEIKAAGADWLFVPLEAAMKMRSSFILLGPLLTRFGRVIISNPGGDRIGRRPVDLHVDAMRTLGAEIEYKNGYYFAQAPGGLRGARITFPYVTVMGTENAMLAATLAKGTTVIENAAQEPEVDDLVGMLQAMGAQIERTAPHRLEIQGVDRLRGVEHTVLGDRLEAGTFAMAAAVTGGEVTIRGVNPEHLTAFTDLLTRMGISLETFQTDGGGLRVRGGDGIKPADVETQPYPGFPTDLQAPVAVLMTQADGVSTIHETIYEDRLDYTMELAKMGAVIEILDERHASIAGPTALHGREVEIADLRAGATLILAALAAAETSVISGVEHVDRGYEAIESKLVDLGAQITRIDA
ncbi:MAG TPA: UDP-N-acetylglucosamine 1-carboxyvinyltransferase [Methylomirabilota bacterium]|jgi:UDP-N-acetylglucosamine 1-carboxyvinyltransferase|nr:UDP-N-acetylglucosamine 1-carboxyvinyltransferase [Methylomirabilota bacterium]